MFRCRLFGHEYVTTPEYRNGTERVQADKICTKCGDSELAWLGATVEEYREETGDQPPVKAKAYEQATA